MPSSSSRSMTGGAIGHKSGGLIINSKAVVAAMLYGSAAKYVDGSSRQANGSDTPTMVGICDPAGIGTEGNPHGGGSTSGFAGTDDGGGMIASWIEAGGAADANCGVGGGGALGASSADALGGTAFGNSWKDSVNECGAGAAKGMAGSDADACGPVCWLGGSSCGGGFALATF